MSTSAWERALNGMMGKRAHQDLMDGAWLAYLASRLPRAERMTVLKHMKAEKSPGDYVDSGGPPGGGLGVRRLAYVPTE